jgi:sugar phosphate isomerase/epimerase
MDIGIFAKTFPRPSLPETLDAVAEAGITVMQFNMALTGLGTSMPDEIPFVVAAGVREEAQRRGLTTAAVSGTYNTAHPDRAVRTAGLRRLGELLGAAATLGTSTVTLCTGSRDAEDMWRWHPDNATPEAWADMRESLEGALALAERHGVTLAFEPEHNNVVNDAAAGRRILDELGRPELLKVVIDPANLFPGGGLERQDQVLEEAFALLGGDVVLAHAKDVTADGAIVPAGQGALDYAAYIALLRAAAPDVPLVLHGLGEDEVAASVARVRAALAQAPAA